MNEKEYTYTIRLLSKMLKDRVYIDRKYRDMGGKIEYRECSMCGKDDYNNEKTLKHADNCFIHTLNNIIECFESKT